MCHISKVLSIFFHRVHWMLDSPTCRICGEFGDAESPLYHPCRCTGSIRFVHDICLVKWLTMKATGSLAEDRRIADLNETKCELCGFNFRFTPVYSQGFSPRQSVFDPSLVYEISRSLIVRGTHKFASIILSVLWTLLAPVLIGATVIRLILYWNELPQSVHWVSQSAGSIVLYYIVGMFSMVLGILFMVIATRAREMPQFPRNIRSALLLILLAALSGSAITILPYLTGRSFRKLFTTLCQTEYFFCIDYDTSDTVSLHLSHISIGIGILMIGGILGIIVRRMYRAGLTACLASLRHMGSIITRTSAYLLVPLTVGCLVASTILSQDSQFNLSNKLTPFGSLIIHIAIGAATIIPTVLLERFMFSHLVPRALRNDIVQQTRICHVIFCGRKVQEFSAPITTICLESSVRIFVHTVVVFLSLLPAKKFLSILNLVPFTMDSRPSEHKTLGLVLPTELFYAHVLVPLALNVPRPPRILRRNFDLICRKFRYTEFLRPLNIPTIIMWMGIRLIMVFVAAIVVVALPTLAARLVFNTDDIVSLSVGALIVAGFVNICIRIMSSLEKSSSSSQQSSSHRPRLPSDADTNVPSSPFITREMVIRSVKFFSLAIYSVVVLPMLVGVAFHSTIVAPLRYLVSDLNVRNGVEDEDPAHVHPPKTLWMMITPVWIVGLMLMKIVFALISVGNRGIIFPNLRTYLDTVTRAYDRNGLVSNELRIATFNVAWYITKTLVTQVFLPELIGLSISYISPHVVPQSLLLFIPDTYLMCTFLYRVVFPSIVGIIQAEKRAILNQKYLVRTELQNFVLDDSLIGQEGRPGTPLPSIRPLQAVLGHT